ncbi:MAG TPA: hypothetical protein VKS82_21725 [Streptosporangiaceae bacterium]|nr:hypothetical protein [Streptosporangiaceae bacterium]
MEPADRRPAPAGPRPPGPSRPAPTRAWRARAGPPASTPLARQHAQQALDIYAGLDVPAAAQPRAATAELS